MRFIVLLLAALFYIASFLMASGAVNAAVYYISDTGSDITGAADDVNSPFQSITHVKGLSLSSGDDIYLECGSVFNGQYIDITHGGTSGNHAVFGSYYGATPTLNDCAGGGFSDPQMFGAYSQAGDPVGGSSGAIPPGAYSGLIQVSSSYVDVKGIWLRNSSGACIQAQGTSGSPISNITLDGNTCQFTAGQAIAGKRYSSYVYILNNTISQCGQAALNGEWVGPNHGICSGLVGSDYGIVYNNYAFNNEGESFVAFEASEYGIYSYNVVECSHWNSYYIDQAVNSIWERNISIGCNDTNFLKHNPYAENGFGINVERPLGGNSTGVIIRNNIIIGMNTGIATTMLSPARLQQVTASTISFTSGTNVIADSGSGFGAFVSGMQVTIAGSTFNNGTHTVTAASSGSLTVAESLTNESAGASVTASGRMQVQFDFIGNTVVGNNYAFRSTFLTNDLIQPSTIKNNLFTENATECAVVTSGEGGIPNTALQVSEMDFDYNHTDTAFTDLDCDGVNDVHGDPLLTGTGWTSMSSPPDTSLVSPQPTSGALDGGLDLTSSIPNIANYLQSGDLPYTLDTTYLSEDFLGNARSTTDIGAIEGTIAVDPDVTVPFYMEIGESPATNVVVSETYLAQDYIDLTGASYKTETGDVLGTTDDALYLKSIEKNGTLKWDIPIADGTYDVGLHFIERYWGYVTGTCDSNGSNRNFDILIEGVLVANEFDICANALAAFTAFTKVFPNIVIDSATADGFLTIELRLGSSSDPKPSIAGLYVATASPTGNTMTVANATVNHSGVNRFPTDLLIDPITLAGVTSTAVDPIYISSIDTTGLTAGAAVIDADSNSTLIAYTPADANSAGSVGSIVVNFADGEDTGTTTINLTLTQVATGTISFTAQASNGTGRVKMTSQTGLKYWLINLSDNTALVGTGESTDASGVFEYTDVNVIAGINYRAVIMIPGWSTIGTDTTYNRIYTRQTTAN